MTHIISGTESFVDDEPTGAPGGPGREAAVTRAGRARLARRARRRRRFFIAGIVTAFLLGFSAVTAGLLGFGMPQTFQQAPVVEHPFTAADPDTHAGPETPPVMGPLEIAIPSIDVHAHIVDIGLEPGSDAMVIPSSDKVGHYTPAAPIGAAKGSTLIAGHVNFADWSPGALWNLSKAVKGAHAYITDASGKQFTYTITTARTLTRKPLPADTYATDGPPQLTIVTCAGTPGPDGKVLNYDQNTIITATPIRGP
ncbi:sortase (surface protein transpeptidase) [Arthrobacter sp. GAS37]|uniref:class F sortase n=1 Tax=Arthrobacter sp. GAS37 TaxID=3156261 RepID=UPI00383800DB